uniref:Uncharacterized protein n=1 Tax=Anguilla anguilla TaxID=7936 RepID=A0A0E9VYW6_ANGAN
MFHNANYYSIWSLRFLATLSNQLLLMLRQTCASCMLYFVCSSLPLCVMCFYYI